MSNPNPQNQPSPKDEDKIRQTTGNVDGRNTQIVGNNNNSTNVNVFIFITFFVVLALGGLAWWLVFGQNNNGQNTQSGQQQSAPILSPGKTP